MDKKDQINYVKSQRDVWAEKAKRRLEDPLCDVFTYSVEELEGIENDIEFWETNTVLDVLTGCGLSRDSLTVLIGGTGDGKSLLLTHLASKMSENKKILYVSFENTSKVDNSRFKDCKNVYEHANHKNIHYINILDNEMEDRVQWSNKYLTPLVMEEKYDLVCIDAIQTTIDAVEQDEIHKTGNVLMKELYKLVLNSRTPMIVTWQAARSTAGKKLKEVTLDDISGSIGTVRYATNAFFIKRDGESYNRNLKILKCRESKNARWADPVIDLELSLRFSVEKIF